MQFEVDEAQKRGARLPHNLFVLNILLFHLLLTPAAIVIDIGMYGFLLPLFCSLSVIGYIYLRAQRIQNWFVDMHWRLTLRRACYLMIGYGITAVILTVAWLITLGSSDARLADIMFTAISRVAVVPTLIAAMVTVVLEAGGHHMVNRGEVPDRLAEAFPRKGYGADKSLIR